MTLVGSSPLSRGIPEKWKSPVNIKGIIPALAGNTPYVESNFHRHKDHPRSRGEYSGQGDGDGDPQGSSPLSRGIPTWWQGLRGNGRIIPALAGNTNAGSYNSSTSRDHPRSRGEYPGLSWRSAWELGSSPLSRGIPQSQWPSPSVKRIIPALAGNTPHSGGITPTPWDHPRSRGEYPMYSIEHHCEAGSSPLSRGIPPVAHIPAQHGRIIPALAGNTRRYWRMARRTWDHPRSRGEYFPLEESKKDRFGSSPLSRGILSLFFS